MLILIRIFEAEKRALGTGLITLVEFREKVSGLTVAVVFKRIGCDV